MLLVGSVTKQMASPELALLFHLKRAGWPLFHLAWSLEEVSKILPRSALVYQDIYGLRLAVEGFFFLSVRFRGLTVTKHSGAGFSSASLWQGSRV